MNVLSLFDGMSCGRIALERAGIPVTNYFASEIDKYAIQVSKANWSDIKHVGSVVGLIITYDDFLNTTNINNFLTGEDFTFEGKFDFIIGGSPCQGFSFAGLQLNFNDPRSKLFFEFAKLLEVIREHNPDVKYFLENVLMKKEYQDVITKTLGGLAPVMLNSSLVSAQNRKRLYWTNIPFIGVPPDRGIVLRNILETEGIGYIKNRGEYYERSDKGMGLVANYFKGTDNHGMRTCIRVGDIYPSGGMAGRVYSTEGKSPALVVADTGGNKMPKIQISEYEDDKLIIPEATKKGYIEVKPGECFDNTFPASKTRHGRQMTEKSNTLTAANYEFNRYLGKGIYRKLTPVECERLQTVEDNYTACVSNTQRYKMLGNGWTIEAIVWFFLPLNPGYNFLF